MIAIVDYGRGNLHSLSQALKFIGASSRVVCDPRELAHANAIILPGVGAFGDAMDNLHAAGFIDPIIAAAQAGTPLLGICLGMQMLTDRSTEHGSYAGLGLIPGSVDRLPEGGGSAKSVRIPNVGWRRIDPTANDKRFMASDMMYFVHSYVPYLSADSQVAATIEINGHNVAAIISRDNVVGFQFHPEKSGPHGLDLLRAFVKSMRGAPQSV